MNPPPTPNTRLHESIRLLAFTFMGTRGKGDFRPLYQSLITVHQLTWGALNTGVGVLAGLFAIVFLGGNVSRWKTVTVIAIRGRRMQAVALGPIVIGVGALPPDVLDHEMGHWYQSIVLGPLYFGVIGIPSVLHALWFQRAFQKQGRVSERNAYYRFYTEAWADAWGGSWHAHGHRVRRWWHYLGPR